MNLTEETADQGSVNITTTGDVARVMLSNHGKLNAFTWKMYDELAALPAYLDAHEHIRAVVVQGEGDAFAAGTDINQFKDFLSGEQGLEYENRVGTILDGLNGIRVPTIAVVNGPAVGAGLAVAAICDLVIATPSAFFGAPIARKLGNCLPPPVIMRLRARLGINRTMAMLLTSTMISAQEAHTAGFVHRIVAPDALDQEVTRILNRLTTSAPLTLASIKEISRRIENVAHQVDADDLLRLCYGSDDFQEGVAAFTDHRTPVWKGR